MATDPKAFDPPLTAVLNLYNARAKGGFVTIDNPPAKYKQAFFDEHTVGPVPTKNGQRFGVVRGVVDREAYRILEVTTL